MSFLASRRIGLPRWVWVLDSDVVVSRPNALKKAVERAEETDAAVVGESWWDDEHDMDSFLAYSLLIDQYASGGTGSSLSSTAGIPRSACSNPRKRRARHCSSSPSREAAT